MPAEEQRRVKTGGRRRGNVCREADGADRGRTGEEALTDEGRGGPDPAAVLLPLDGHGVLRGDSRGQPPFLGAVRNREPGPQAQNLPGARAYNAGAELVVCSLLGLPMPEPPWLLQEGRVVLPSL